MIKYYLQMGILLCVLLSGIILGARMNSDEPIICESGTEIPSDLQYEVSRTVCNVGSVNGRPVTVIVID